MAIEKEPDVLVSWSSLTTLMSAARLVPPTREITQAISNCEKWMSESAVLEELKEDDG